MGLDTVELVMDVEREFDISFSIAESQAIFTVGDLHKSIVAKVQESCREADAELIWTRLVTILSNGYGVPKAKITRKARIVRDLGLD